MDTPESLSPDYFLKSMDRLGIKDSGRLCSCGARIFFSSRTKSDIPCGACELKRHEAAIEAKVLRDLPVLSERSRVAEEEAKNKKKG